ncbi:hypothetical protein [Streptomyces sp. BA2]|uniref:hypothetical protein n=1 Tax=Streptomyces sp. BA2 TaxID=436595 RepID=UPI0013233100|nr:hypothetical protein [Streptomyces sp. BA2]
MNSRYMPALALILLGTGLAAGVLGLVGDNIDVFRCGIFVTVCSLPLLILRTLRESQHVSAHQLAEADKAGYRRALDHVARGLLDNHTAPTPQGGDRATVEQVAGNVFHIRPLPYKGEERKAL